MRREILASRFLLSLRDWGNGWEHYHPLARVDTGAAERDAAQRGEIVTDERGMTSVPGIFAAGDVTTVPYKQIIIAMGEGSRAAFDHLIRS